MDERRPSEDPRTTRLVFVCHANHCRSPMMELLLRAALDRSSAGTPPLLVSSAGTHARPGTPAHPYAVRALAEHGVDATGWGATRLDVDGIERADLLVTAAAAQRNEIVALSPTAAARTFTLLDLAAWLAAAPTTADRTGAAARGTADLLTRAAAGRATLVPGGRGRRGRAQGERDLPDPMGRSLRHFRRCRRRVEAALEPFLEPVGGGPV